MAMGALAAVLVLAAGIFAATRQRKPARDPFAERTPAPLVAEEPAILQPEPPPPNPGISNSFKKFGDPTPTPAPVSPPTLSEPRFTKPLPQADFVNTLGMRFRRVGITDTNGTAILFSVWETRNADYAAFAAATKRAPLPTHPDANTSPDFPVALVSWTDARDFCAWLTQKEVSEGKLDPSLRYRLPTDHEWSSAAGIAGRGDEHPTISISQKAGMIHDYFPWGIEWPPPPRAGNFSDESARRAGRPWKTIPGYDDGFIGTAPVGTFAPNQNGLYDLAGNVSEWCYDLDDRHLYAPIRGGSYIDNWSVRLLASVRVFALIGDRYSFTGFRVVLVTQKPGGPGPFIPNYHVNAPGKANTDAPVFEKLPQRWVPPRIY